MVLENAVVRAAAVSSLGKFGVEVGERDGGSVGRSVRVLLKRFDSHLSLKSRNKAVDEILFLAFD